MVAGLEPGRSHRLYQSAKGRPGVVLGRRNIERMNYLLLAPELFITDGGIARILRLYLKALCELSSDADEVRFVALNDNIADSTDLRRYSNQRLLNWEACSRSKLRFIRAAFRL